MALRVCILGATGDTGKPLVQQALAAGHEVTAVVRDPSKYSEKHERLRVVQGDVFSAESLKPHFAGQDVVISALGFTKQEKEKMTNFTRSMEAILEGMRGADAKYQRLVTISAWYTNPANRQGQGMYDNMWGKVPGLPNTLDNEGEMEEVLKKSAPGIDWTAVRVATLTWDPPTGKEIMTAEEGNWVEGGSPFIPREDVARFMLEVAASPGQSSSSDLCGCFSRENQKGQWTNKCVAISIKYTDEEMEQAKERFKAHMAMYVKE